MSQPARAPASLRCEHVTYGLAPSLERNVPLFVTLAPERPRTRRVASASVGPLIASSMFALLTLFFAAMNCTGSTLCNVPLTCAACASERAETCGAMFWQIVGSDQSSLLLDM
jgi:hypothetical protein